ncbi:natriuretic peptides A [Salminus brasiliensis]|uniref:natriuretic peptides A n=1 Tax=Salminus brasiliensis TaxID=930266 RepID=UPI003B8342C1
MVKGLILPGLLVLLCHEVAVQAHVLYRHNSANSISKLKSLLQQFEELLAPVEESEGVVDYEDRNMVPSQSQASPGWEKNREEQAPPGEEPSPEEDLEAQKKHLIDLLLSTRSKGFSGCFGGRLDRIGSSSSLGCNSMRG